ncbi:MAG: glycosyltransferase family 2 protein [Limisphaerales bacterium]
MPKTISLIVCTYKRPEQIGRLLRSLAVLTRKPDETLIIDASSDELTRAVADEFAKVGGVPGLRYYLVPREHRGLTQQRNYGVERARGDVIAFLDDDAVPETGYFQEILRCFERHPEAVGVGGNITNGPPWQKAKGRPASLAVFRVGEWERRDDLRWRLRKLCGLQSDLSPGHMPPFGHGRSPGFPPDGQDHQVEFIMGCASSWRRGLLNSTVFSAYFDGYGLYEDLEFCLRAGRQGPIYLCTQAQLAHYHAPSGRPLQFRYGVMVVRNGWVVWRRRWPNPRPTDRCKWWAITALLAACRIGNAVSGPKRSQAVTEFLGRLYGMLIVWVNPPRQQLKNN